MSEPRVKRRYRSPARERDARATRRRIRDAAAARFVADGYAGTSMRAIANDAGVSERTVFLAFPSKAALLSECIRVAVRGDDGDAPLLEREDTRAVFDAPPELMARAVAERSARLLRRAAPLLAVGEGAGDDDPLLGEARERGRAATRADMLAIARAMKRAGAIRRGISAREAADTMYALVAGEQLYLRLVHHCAWSDQRYARFVERALVGALSPPGAPSPRR